MYHTCERCRALEVHNSKDGKCSLGYQIQEFRPLEECPKPLTNLQLMDCKPITDQCNIDK